MANAMGTPATVWTSAQMRLAISRICSLLILLIVVATVNKPVLVDSAPSNLVVFLHERAIPPNETVMVVVSPSGDDGLSSGFGSIAVLDNILRESQAGDSLVLGTAQGSAVLARDASFYLHDTLVLSTSSYGGSISLQGVLASPGNGEVGITTGTGDFRFAKGYANISPVSLEDGINVYQIVLNIQYY